MRRKTFALLALGLAAVASLLFLVRRSRAPHADPALQASLQSVIDDYRKIIVLMDGADTLDDATRARVTASGRVLYWRKQHALEDLGARLAGARDSGAIRQLIAYLTNDPSLHDADKLAFSDLVEELLDTVTQPGAVPRDRELAESLGNLWDNLKSIQAAYREEVSRIFSQFGTRGGKATREKWDAYVAYLRTLTDRDKILQELVDLYTPEPPASSRGGSTEVFGTDFAPKTVALTFDDGPHPKYTEQILAILRKYGIKATFFELGENLGTVDPVGAVKLGPTSEVARKVLAAGHAIANHSYSHPVLPKLPDAQRESEIDRTNLLLAKVMGHNTDLFRAPYGARNKEILAQVTGEGMKSVMWNVDSMDWADPIPESIAMRVLHEINQTHRGIILFHDIHKQSVLALSPVIEELLRQDYTFLAPDKGKFVKAALPPVPTRADEPAATASAAPVSGAAPHHFYRQNWAVLIGINDYQHWPKLRYAVHDATGIEEVLTSKFGFQKDHIRMLLDGDATRQRIMQVLGDELTDSNRVQREDRVFFFFAGHGTTRTFEDGRQVGFIVPVDADQNNYVSTAISMSQIREASDLIPAKHVYFVMDSCYSGLALSRGSGAYAKDRSYLEEITRRQARQILTAGGADQQVADDGPNGHSVFTWAVLQGLQGEADLDGNGVITASELGAYVSPIVAKFANQTPAVGNLVGSEGGEFVFELQPELLTSHSTQEDPKAATLNRQLTGLEKEIAAKQEELLKLQQSIQAETAKLSQVTRTGQAPAASAAAMIARKPQSAPYELDREGLQLYRQKKYDEALQKFQAAAALRPGDPVILNNLGFLYYTVGKYDDAVTNLQKTLALDPKRKEAHENLADTFYKMGRKDDARKEYQQFLALNPGSARSDEVRKILKSLE